MCGANLHLHFSGYKVTLGKVIDKTKCSGDKIVDTTADYSSSTEMSTGNNMNRAFYQLP